MLERIESEVGLQIHYLSVQPNTLNVHEEQGFIQIFCLHSQQCIDNKMGQQCILTQHLVQLLIHNSELPQLKCDLADLYFLHKLNLLQHMRLLSIHFKGYQYSMLRNQQTERVNLELSCDR